MTNPTNSQWDAHITAHPDPKPIEMETCQACRGRGVVTKKITNVIKMVTYTVTYAATCPDCDGAGEVEAGEER